MIRKTMGIAFSALLMVGAFGLAGATTANAQSVAKQCGDQWKAAKAAGSTNGQTWKDFYASCKTKTTATPAAAAPAAAAPAAAPAPAAPAPAAAAAPKPAPAAAAAPKPAPAAAPTMAAKPTGAGEFQTDTEAKGHCPSQNVVWVNTKSHKFHFAGARTYGKTKQGAYMCEGDATAAGNVASKNEKAPQ